MDEDVGYGQEEDEEDGANEEDGNEEEEGAQEKFYDEYGNEIPQEEVEDYMRAQQEQYGEDGGEEGNEGEYGYGDEGQDEGNAEYE